MIYSDDNLRGAIFSQTLRVTCLEVTVYLSVNLKDYVLLIFIEILFTYLLVNFYVNLFLIFLLSFLGGVLRFQLVL